VVYHIQQRGKPSPKRSAKSGVVGFGRPFDQAHPERRQATQAKGFSDLVGKWRWEDYSYASRDAYTREQVGISYTDSGTLEVMPDGQFKRLHVHNHCSSAGTARCCLMTGSSEEGTVEKGMLVFQIQSGAHGVSNSCSSASATQSAIAPHREAFPWSIRLNPVHNNAQTLCWNI